MLLITKVQIKRLQQQQKSQTPQFKKCATGLNRYFSKGDIQMAHNAQEKMLNIINHEGNANQNYKEIVPHIGQNG